MQQESTQPQATALDYATVPYLRRHSFFSFAAAAMAVLTVVWLAYVQFGRPRYHQGGPLWEVLWQWSFLPGATGIMLAIVGLAHAKHKRVLNIVAIVVIVIAYLLLTPPLNFA